MHVLASFNAKFANSSLWLSYRSQVPQDIYMHALLSHSQDVTDSVHARILVLGYSCACILLDGF